MSAIQILWVDDEIDLLRPHIIFLEQHGYQVTPCVSGADALDLLQEQAYDLVFLDEQMPGLSGLETLARIAPLYPYLPVVMVTKSEEEHLMNEAISRQIADYLIKPVNPHQLLLSLKKVLHREQIVTEATQQNYIQAFRELSLRINSAGTIDEWMAVYKEISKWVMQVDNYLPDMAETLQSQRDEANRLFAKYIIKEYEGWIQNPKSAPTMSHTLMRDKVFPMLDRGERIFLILIDNFRWDQWLAVQEMLSGLFTFDDGMYTAILPTATQYARNAIFSGLMPLEIAKTFPELWVDEESEEGKNLNEEPMIASLLKRYRKPYSFAYRKVYETSFGERLLTQLNELEDNQLNVIVLNFVDMLSHARTESKMIRELASSEAAYRSLTQSWFRHSTTYRLFEQIAQMGAKIILTTDHGTVRVRKPVKIVGNRNTSTNLRYKLGQSLTFDAKEAYAPRKPKDIGLPVNHLTDGYVFCYEQNFFAYPNNYNYYVNYYRDTLQHGGISMEEMLVPCITLTPR